MTSQTYMPRPGHPSRSVGCEDQCCQHGVCRVCRVSSLSDRTQIGCLIACAATFVGCKYRFMYVNLSENRHGHFDGKRHNTFQSDPRETLDNSRQPQASVPDIFPKIFRKFWSQLIPDFLRGVIGTKLKIFVTIFWISYQLVKVSTLYLTIFHFSNIHHNWSYQ